MTVAALLITPTTSGATTSALTRACGSTPGIACRLVWDLSHSAHAADLTNVYLVGPIRLVLRIAFVLLLAVILRVAAQRLIRRLTARAVLGPGRSDPLASHETSGDDGAAEAEAVPAGAAPADAIDGSVAAAGPGIRPAATRRNAARRAAATGRRSQRATALAGVLSNAASVTIFTVAGVIILGDLGLNLAPVLASAGVLGIAIGFGAQNLVQDFLAGIFILMEDQYGVGDVIEVGSVSGTVEAVSLRITRLRDTGGVVWHIRNGTIKKAGNQTHGWARAVVDFPVPYQVPVAAARRSLDQAAASMWAEPAWHAVILDRPQVWGVEDVSADQVLIRVVARTAPQGKLDVARELRERLKAALDATAIAAPSSLAESVPHQTDSPAD